MELSTPEPIHSSTRACPSQGLEKVPETLPSLYFLLFQPLVSKKRLWLLKLDTNHPLIVKKEKSYWNMILKKTMKMFQPKGKKEKE